MTKDSPISAIQPPADGVPLVPLPADKAHDERDFDAAPLTLTERLRRAWRNAVPMPSEALQFERRTQVLTPLGMWLVFVAVLYAVWMYLGPPN